MVEILHGTHGPALSPGDREGGAKPLWILEFTCDFKQGCFVCLGFFCKKLNLSQFSDLKTDITINFLRILFSLINQRS